MSDRAPPLSAVGQRWDSETELLGGNAELRGEVIGGDGAERGRTDCLHRPGHIGQPRAPCIGQRHEHDAAAMVKGTAYTLAMPPRRTPQKYQPLTAYLADLPTDRVTLTLAAIEQIIGAPLPRSAQARHWWANTSSWSWSRAWLTAGWSVAIADMRHGVETVTFARQPAGTDHQPFGSR